MSSSWSKTNEQGKWRAWRMSSICCSVLYMSPFVPVMYMFICAQSRDKRCDHKGSLEMHVNVRWELLLSCLLVIGPLRVDA